MDLIYQCFTLILSKVESPRFKWNPNMYFKYWSKEYPLTFSFFYKEQIYSHIWSNYVYQTHTHIRIYVSVCVCMHVCECFILLKTCTTRKKKLAWWNRHNHTLYQPLKIRNSSVPIALVPAKRSPTVNLAETSEAVCV